MMEGGYITTDEGEVELKHLDSPEMENTFTRKTVDKGPDGDTDHDPRKQKQYNEHHPKTSFQDKTSEETTTMIE